MKRGFLPSLLLTAIVIFPALFCGGDLQDPWTDPASSVIRDDRSLTTLPPAVNEYQEYQCSLYVLLPALSDSIRVVMRATSGDIVLWQLDSLSVADTATGLSLYFPAGVQSPVRVYLFRKNGTIDSLVKAVVVRHPPSAAPEAERYSTYINVPVHPVFSITDPDGDIRSCQIWIDSTTGQAIVPQLTRASATLASVTCAVSSPSFDSMIVFAQALDSAGNGSAFAQCTVFVMDTGKPRLSLLRISPSINDSIVNNLPCSLLVKIQDDSPIDSAAYAVNPFIKHPMTMINDTTALAIIAELDSGGNFYEAQAWDRAGNLGTHQVPILYTGSTVYRFTFSNIIDRTINENGTFPSINLDSSISLNPPPIGVPNWKADVAWQILETKPDSGIRPTLNPTTRVVTFAVSDSEWSGTESFTFIASWNGMATGYAGAIYKINPINDPPVIIWKGATKKSTAVFDTVLADKCVRDPDNKPGEMTWVEDSGKIFYLHRISGLIIGGAPQSATATPSYLSVIIPIDPIKLLWSRRWAISVKPGLKLLRGWTGSDTLQIRATDPTGLSDTMKAVITVN